MSLSVAGYAINRWASARPDVPDQVALPATRASTSHNFPTRRRNQWFEGYMDQMTEPTRQPRPFDDPDTDEFAVEYDETWIVDRSPENAEENES